MTRAPVALDPFSADTLDAPTFLAPRDVALYLGSLPDAVLREVVTLFGGGESGSVADLCARELYRRATL